MTSSQPREQNTAMADAMWRGHGGWELALAPVLFGLGGWFLDGQLATRPVLTVVGAVVGLVGSVVNQYFQYKYRMDLAAAERRQARKASEATA